MSEMVQHKNILEQNTNRKSHVAYRMTLTRMTSENMLCIYYDMFTHQYWTAWLVMSSCIELKDFTCSQAVMYTANAVMYTVARAGQYA